MMEAENPRKKLSAYLLYRISGREMSSFELREKTLQKFPQTDELMLDELIAELEDQNLLSNARYCEMFIDDRQRKNWSLQKIKHHFFAKKIPEIFYKDVLQTKTDHAALLKIIPKLAKKTKPEEAKNPEKKRQRITQQLFQKGFLYGDIQEVLDEIGE